MDTIHKILGAVKNLTCWGWPSGVMVKFVCSALVAWGSQVQILSSDLASLVKPRCGSIPHKIEEDWHSSGSIFLTHTHTQISTEPLWYNLLKVTLEK